MTWILTRTTLNPHLHGPRVGEQVFGRCERGSLFLREERQFARATQFQNEETARLTAQAHLIHMGEEWLVKEVPKQGGEQP